MRRTVLALAVSALTVSSAVAQTKSADHWVATWATAVVARAPIVPPAAAPAPAPAATAGAPPIVPAPPGPPPITPNNQTLRQIVRTSIGGSGIAFGQA